jgi:tRNA 2-selenouridine synthase
VLDLEMLAAHRGSVLGGLPDAAQPTQKLFESRIWNELAGFDPARPVYVEAESKKVGDLRVPEPLIEAMWDSECVVIEAPMPVRVALLKEEYAHFLEQPETLIAKLECLTSLHGRAVIDRWRENALARQWDELTADLLVSHYDPAYTRAITKHYPALSRALKLAAHGAEEREFQAMARRCIESEIKSPTRETR